MMAVVCQSVPYLTLHGSFLNITVKKNENCSTVAEVIVKIKLAYFFETRCIRKIRDVILSFCMKFTTKIALTVVDHFHPGDVRFFVVNVADFVHQPNAKPNV